MAQIQIPGVEDPNYIIIIYNLIVALELIFWGIFFSVIS